MTYSILLIVLPLLLAFLSVFLKKGKDNLLYLGLLINFMLLFMLEKGVYLVGGYEKAIGISLVVDSYSYLAVILINVLFALAVVANHKDIKNFPTVLLSLLAGLNGLVMTGDLFNLFVFLEITSISLFVLTTSSKKYLATFNYIIIGALGSAIYLIGVIILYANFGNLDIELISQTAKISDLNLFIPLLFIFIGLSVEVKLIPFNGWVKAIYKDANGLVSSLMASVVATASLFVMGRLLNALLIGNDKLLVSIMVIAILTLIGGELAAFKSKTIKEILLYSSIGQAGLITLLLASGFIFPAMLLIINNAVAKLIMFSTASELSDTNEDYGLLKGIFSNQKLLGIGFTIASFSLIGLPLFLGFYGKINGLMALFELNIFLPFLVLIITVIEGAYLIKLNISLWHPGEEGEHVSQVEDQPSKLNLSLIATSLLLSTLILLLGIMPNVLGDKLMEDDINYETYNEYLIDLKGGK